MQVIQSKMKQWLKGFSIFAQIMRVFLGIGIGAISVLAIFLVSKKDVLTTQIDDTTVGELLMEVEITSRWELFAQLMLVLLGIALAFFTVTLIYKWLKTTATTGEPFTTDSIKYMRKSAKSIYIACLVCFIIEIIITMFIDTGALLLEVDYFSIILLGLIIHGLSYVFAYASVIRKEEFVTEDKTEQNTDSLIEK